MGSCLFSCWHWWLWWHSPRAVTALRGCQSLSQCLPLVTNCFLILEQTPKCPRAQLQALRPPNCPISRRCGAQTKGKALWGGSQLEREGWRRFGPLGTPGALPSHQTPHSYSSHLLQLCQAPAHQELDSAASLWVGNGLQVCSFPHSAGCDLPHWLRNDISVVLDPKSLF